MPITESVDQSAPRNPRIDEVRYLWDEYKYRHQLCWSAVYKLTIAVVALGVLPYAKDQLSRLLGPFMLVPAILGASLAGFGILVVRNELALFAKIKLAYRIVQNRLLESLIDDPALAAYTKEELSPTTTTRTLFDWFVLTFMAMLFSLSVLNVLFLVLRWLPQLGEPCK